MSQVPYEIMNKFRGEMHVSDTIISANHPDAQTPPSSPEIDTPPPQETVLKRVIARFTFNSIGAEIPKS